MKLPAAETDVPPSQVTFPVVGIGASAGGIRALMEFFAQSEARSGAAYVVVVHLSPEHESSIPQLLSSTTAIPVTAVTAQTRIEPNHVYVISPRTELVMQDGHLEPVNSRRGKGGTYSIDRFFHTLADAHHSRAACVVLSGTGSDGTLGLKAVKANGGVTLVQAPEDAEHDGMPRAAIASGLVDFVLPVAEMPRRLADIWKNAKAIQLPQLEDKPTPEDVAAIAEDALRDVLSILRARTGHDFSQYKRATLLRRLERRMQVVQVRDLPGYRDFLRAHGEEARRLLGDFLISVTSFFRDAAAFEALEKKVVPALFEGKEHGGKVRVWVVGCATGEEAYSIAMLLSEHAHRRTSPVEINIFATDIDEDALAFARAGLYPDSVSDQLSAERLRRFFVKEPDGFRVQKSLREMVMFATHNVIQDPPFSKVDLVLCRNLLIYLNRHVQSKVIDLLHFSIRTDGYLFLGMSESIDDNHDGFVVVDKAMRIYQQQPRARVGKVLAALPTLTPVRLPAEATNGGRRQVSYLELHQSLLEHYAPPSLIVDDRYDVVHLSENAGRFLQMGVGEPSLNLLRIAPDELRFELRSALETAMQTMRSVERRALPLRRGPQSTHVSVRIHPVREKTTARTYALVLFEEGGDVVAGAAPEAIDGDSVAGRLEERLHDTQAQLRAAVEQYEIQNEELKASNEELQATNEELRATSEELETGKEELQSINEELTTVNQELKNKVDETTRISDDLQNFINATEIAVLFVDREFRLMRCTPPAREIFNVIASDIGRPLLHVTHKLEDANLESDLTGVFESLRPAEREIRTGDGRWYIQRILPYRTKDDRIGGAVLTFIDVTLRKQAEELTRHSRSWLEVIVDTVEDYAIMTLTPDGIVQTWNRGAEKIFGYTPAEIVGQHFATLFLPEDRAAGTPEEELRIARETGRAQDDRWQLRKDGTRFYASGINARLHDVHLNGFVKLLRDLTEQQLAAQRREELLEMERAHRAAAEEANRIKDEFLATLSHELRNPLALVLMQSELLLRSKELREEPRLANAAEIIHQMVRTQSQFVEDLLDVSRARTGKLTIDRQLVPLSYLIADSVGALREEGQKNEISLDVQLSQEPLIVDADAVRVKQVAWNLLSNAFKFTPRGGHVKVSLRREGDEARLDVEDTGQGIPPDLLPHVFEWFRQGEAGSTRRKGGMGIGLALVRQLVDLHGGRVEAYSPGPGRGSRFTVWLPLQQAADTRGYPTPVPAIVNEERLTGARVLIIDDAPANADALRELLQLEGADAQIATTAHDALARAQMEQFDVIISDLAMPEVDGHALLGQLRATPLNATTPAIAYSGYGGPEDVARSRSAGFEVHVTKPADLNRLVETINELRKRRQSTAAR